MQYSKPIAVTGGKHNGKLYRISIVRVFNENAEETRSFFQLSIYNDQAGSYIPIQDLNRQDFATLEDAKQYLETMF